MNAAEAGALLRRERITRGLSQRQAADAIGVDRGVLERAELGKQPNPSNALRVANFYGLDVLTLWPLAGEAA